MNSTMSVPVIQVTLDSDGEAVARRLKDGFDGRVQVTTSGHPAPTVELISPRAAAEWDPERPPKHAVAVAGDAELTEIVTLLGNRPWLNHVVSPQALLSDAPAPMGVLWKLAFGRKLTGSGYFGTEFDGRVATLRDSAKRWRRLDAILERATAAGASERVGERIREVAEEMVTNALYDAPAERHQRASDRSVRTVLEREEACTITYGASGKMFFVRVRDPYGALRRERLCSVLMRCAPDREVAMDSSSGGAGLGLWRIFKIASLVLVQVQPQVCTEFVAGIELRGPRSATNRSVHLFFDEPAPESGR
jgi:hypothetical protein